MKKQILPITLLIVLFACLGCPDSNVEEYLRDLKSSNVVVKREAVYKVGKLQIKEAVPELLNLMKEDSGETFTEIIEALGRIGDQSAVEPLLAILNTDNALIREKAIEALGKIGDRRAVSALISIIEQRESKSESETLTAIWALGNIGDRTAEPTLNSLFKQHNNKYVQYNVEQALKKIRTTTAESTEITHESKKVEMPQANDSAQTEKTVFYKVLNFIKGQIESIKEAVSIEITPAEEKTRIPDAETESENKPLENNIKTLPVTEKSTNSIRPPIMAMASLFGEINVQNEIARNTIRWFQRLGYTDSHPHDQAKNVNPKIMEDEKRSVPEPEVIALKTTIKPENIIQQDRPVPADTDVKRKISSSNPEPTTDSVPEAENKVYNLNELPLSIRQSLPNFFISFFVYSDDTSSRMVKINGEMMQEDEYLTDNLRLEEITPDGVILKYQNYRFRVRLK